MGETEEAVSVEYKLGRSEMKNEILELIADLKERTIEEKMDNSSFSENKSAIVAALASLSTVIKARIKE